MQLHPVVIRWCMLPCNLREITSLIDSADWAKYGNVEGKLWEHGCISQESWDHWRETSSTRICASNRRKAIADWPASLHACHYAKQWLYLSILPYVGGRRMR